jgi:aminoglycoside phosphotransferase (APT) family kinase protein
MTVRRLHADEIVVDEKLARRLVEVQFPDWRALAITPVPSNGTDNVMFRFGETMALRFPRRPTAAAQVEKEQTWLPRLAPQLPLAVPVPIACGAPGEGYPWRWSVCRWVEGERVSHVEDERRLALDLAAFVIALRRIEACAGPVPGKHNSGRGVPLAMRDAATHEAIAALRDAIDANAVTAAWESDSRVPAWSGAPQWIHGDLSAGNLLVSSGVLCGVIDFGCLGVGDPACDLLVAWNLFSGEAREAYRDALGRDEAMWRRGRGWALSVALIQLPYYRDSNPTLAENARRTIEAVLADHCRG